MRQIFLSKIIMASFADRLNHLKDCLKIESGRKFAEHIGISHGNYQSYLKGALPKMNVLVNILSSINGLNPLWLLRGDLPVFVEIYKTDKVELSVLAKNQAEYLTTKDIHIRELINTLRAQLDEKDKQIAALIQNQKNDIAEGA